MHCVSPVAKLSAVSLGDSSGATVKFSSPDSPEKRRIKMIGRRSNPNDDSSINLLEGSFEDSYDEHDVSHPSPEGSSSAAQSTSREAEKSPGNFQHAKQFGLGARFISILLPESRFSRSTRNLYFKLFILIITFITYCSFHVSRKPISVVKTVLEPPEDENSPKKGWAPFDSDNYKTLFAGLDGAFLFAYAIGMFFSGHLAERFDLRYFIFCGASASAAFTALFGAGFYLKIHSYVFFFCVQLIGGVLQSSGWPAVVTCLSNWYGKENRGLLMGIWTAHTSLGNILGSILAGIWVEQAWGLSFIVPGAILGVVGILNLLFLIPFPEYVNCYDPMILRNGKETPPVSRRTRAIAIKSDEDLSEELLQSEDELEDSIYVKQEDKLTSIRLSNSSTASNPPVSFTRAAAIPGVVAYSLCLFFNKLVSYTFLYWLPVYIQHTTDDTPKESAFLSTLFDVGGIIGCIVAGAITDYTGERATFCAIMLASSVPCLYIYLLYGNVFPKSLLFISGVFVNGPYGLITTAVAADLGTHPSIGGSSRALATVSAIIDGTGSLGAALGPLLAGVISKFADWGNVIYVLIGAEVLALIFLFSQISQRRCNQR